MLDGPGEKDCAAQDERDTERLTLPWRYEPLAANPFKSLKQAHESILPLLTLHDTVYPAYGNES